MRLCGISGLLAGLACLPVAAETRFSVFGGVLTDNPWEEVVLMPWKVDVQRPGFLGVSVSHPVGSGFDTRLGRLRFEIEGQIVRHAGLQNHWEFNLPVTARLTPARPVLGLVDTVAFGIGPSYATRRPSFEAVRGRGNASRVLIYWHVEVEHTLSNGASLFGRLHHRSDGFGAIGPGGSSNALVVGSRWGF